MSKWYLQRIAQGCNFMEKNKMYRDSRIDFSLNQIKNKRNSISKLSERGNNYIKIFNDFLERNDFTIINIKEGLIIFLLYGQEIEVRIEFRIDTEAESYRPEYAFNSCNINAYIKETEDDFTVLCSFTFDKIGNINRIHTEGEFSEYFLIEIEKSLIKMLEESDYYIKLQKL